jgi:hypothetical protein
MKYRSTITNLLEYAYFVLNSIEDGKQVDFIYTDFSKAFDRVRHQLLLNEMSVSIEPARCMWLESYLSGRIQKRRIGDAVSKDIKVTSGVPQRSHLGPLCFIWFFNRISEIFDYVRVLFYTDDKKLFLPVSGFQDCLKIQSDLKVIMDEKMTFSEHVDVMVVKAFAMLGFIRRLSLEFRDPYALKSL